MANTLNWHLGHEGKGNVYSNGDISTWNVNEYGEPHHDEKANEDEDSPVFKFYITPEGGIHDGGLTFHNASPYTDDQQIADIVEQHPAIWDARNENTEEYNSETPRGEYGHAYNLLNVMSKIGVNQEGWADFHTELKLPRSIRKKIRRWVDQLDWPEGHEKEDARRYHITILSMDEYDEKFAKWARNQIRGRVFNFKSTGMDIFGDETVVLRLDCPEWTELVLEWQKEADDQGLEPRKFNPPKAHVTIGKSPEGKWPQGIPNPHLKFDTRMFNINKNSAQGEPWRPGVWGKGLVYNEEPIVWETTAPSYGGEMSPAHPEYGRENLGEYPTKHNAPIVVSPQGKYIPAPHWNISGELLMGSQDPLIQRELDALDQRLNLYEQHPQMKRIDPSEWKKETRPQAPSGGFGHAQNVLDILNKNSMAVDPEFLNSWTEDNPYLYHGRQEHPDVVRQYGIEPSYASYYPTPSVYLTNQQELAEHFAQNPGAEPDWYQEDDPYYEHGSEHPGNWVYVIDSRKLDPSRIDADEWNVDRYPEGHGYHGDEFSVTPELERHLSDPATVQRQFEMGRPLAYRGGISPEAIVDHYEMPLDKPRPWLNGMRGSSVEITPDEDLKAWLDSFNVEQEKQPPSLHHTDADQFMPQIVAPVVQTPHVDPPSKPYKPYNWAEEGWEESPLDRTAASEEELYGPQKPPLTVSEHDDPYEREWPEDFGTSDTRRPFLYNQSKRHLIVGQPGMMHEDFGLDLYGDPDWNQGEVNLSMPNEPTFIWDSPFKKWPDSDEILEALRNHTGEDIRRYEEWRKHTSSLDTHVCPKCGEDVDGPICSICGHDPQNSPDDYQQMKSDWYNRAWSVPGNQPQPTPRELHPHHWRDDHVKDVKMAASQVMYHVAPQHARESIEKYGLDHTKGKRVWPGIYPEGNYLFGDWDSAYAQALTHQQPVEPEYADWAVHPVDVYRVNTGGLDLQSDSKLEGQYVSSNPIGPERLERIPDWMRWDVEGPDDDMWLSKRKSNDMDNSRGRHMGGSARSWRPSNNMYSLRHGESSSFQAGQKEGRDPVRGLRGAVSRSSPVGGWHEV